ncbi:lactate dehydrogenase [Mediterraneibacter gnavus]|nr:lactate dehydrogenase [Mediterraneibacter gnavus]PLT81904.1 lactate dehydrogenase [Mediterraneibacter gnavus]
MILGASILQLPAIRKAKEMGLQVITVDMDENAIGFKEEGIICEVISTIDSEKILEAAKKHNIDGIMTLASDMPMRSVAIVAKEMGLVGITEQTALNATNKAEMRQCLKESGVPIPQFFRVSSKEEYEEAIDYFKTSKLKCIVKPADNSGSRGVDLLSDLSDEELISRAYEYSKSYSRGGDIVVEEYMEGPEVSVETLSVDGECHIIQITDKLTTGAPYFVEMGHSEPSAQPEDIKVRISEVASAAVKAIGIENGPSHTEIKVTKDGPKIVELGARLGGDNITTHLVPLSTGVDMVECCIKIALGEKPDLERKCELGSAIRYFKTEKGIITNIIGIEDAKKLYGVMQVSIVHGIGEKVSEIKNSIDRIGFVIAQGENAVNAVEICEDALRKIKFEVE